MIIRLFLSCSLLLISHLAYAQHQTTAVAVQSPTSLHLRVVESLLRHDAVIPIVPDVHPLKTVYNREAIIPPQCYTDTEGHYNPCYVCHQNAIKGRENVMNDGGLQIAYSFSDLGMTNRVPFF